MKKLVGACACALVDLCAWTMTPVMLAIYVAALGAVVGIAAGATVWAFQANSG
jgi:hypothetical protein